MIRSSPQRFRAWVRRCALALCLLTASEGFAADITAIWNGGTGDWSNPAFWSFSTPTSLLFPANNSSDQFVVLIDGGKSATASTATLNVDVTINGMTVDAGDALMSSGRSLSLVGGELVNGGTVSFTEDGWLQLDGANVSNGGQMTFTSRSLAEAGGSPFGAGLLVEGTVTLNGGGVLRLDGPADVVVRAADQDPDMMRSRSFIAPPGGGSGTLVNQGHTIAGTGHLGFGLRLSNEAGGVIDADVANAALVIGSFNPLTGIAGMVNHGTVQASGGGILRLLAARRVCQLGGRAPLGYRNHRRAGAGERHCFRRVLGRHAGIPRRRELRRSHGSADRRNCVRRFRSLPRFWRCHARCRPARRRLADRRIQSGAWRLLRRDGRRLVPGGPRLARLPVFPTLAGDLAFRADFVSLQDQYALRLSVVAASVPEPGTLALLLVAVLALGVLSRRATRPVY